MISTKAINIQKLSLIKEILLPFLCIHLTGNSLIKKSYEFANITISISCANPKEFKSMISQIRNVEIALGYNEKRILNSELEGLKKARRSLYAGTDIKKNEYFTEENISILRPANGLKPIDIYKFKDKKSKRNIKKGTLLKLSMIDK